MPFRVEAKYVRATLGGWIHDLNLVVEGWYLRCSPLFKQVLDGTARQ